MATMATATVLDRQRRRIGPALTRIDLTKGIEMSGGSGASVERGPVQGVSAADRGSPVADAVSG
jgi:hypothetical protein